MPTRNCLPRRQAARSWRSFISRGGVVAVLVVSAAVANPIKEISYKPIEAPNACLPDAVGFQNAYKVFQKMRHSGSWSRVLMVHSGARSASAPGHAFCVFALEGKLWAYDQGGGCRRVWVSIAEKTDAMKVGRVLAPEQFNRALWVDQSF